jgi:hypothetical protein
VNILKYREKYSADNLLTAREQMSGQEFLGAMQKGELPLPPICELVGFKPAEVEEGRVVFGCTPALI